MLRTTTINIPIEGPVHGDALLEISVQCMACLNWKENIVCNAFPDGIPEEILTGEHDHTESFDGDNGITFEPLPTDER